MKKWVQLIILGLMVIRGACVIASPRDDSGDKGLHLETTFYIPKASIKLRLTEIKENEKSVDCLKTSLNSLQPFSLTFDVLGWDEKLLQTIVLTKIPSYFDPIQSLFKPSFFHVDVMQHEEPRVEDLTVNHPNGMETLFVFLKKIKLCKKDTEFRVLRPFLASLIELYKMLGFSENTDEPSYLFLKFQNIHFDPSFIPKK